MKPRFFATPSRWRRWLAAHHATHDELWVGFFKKGSGRPSITWPESVDQALCFGWIDGVRRSLDAVSYAIRFTPRREGSTWSAVNIRRAAQLKEQGLMHPAGLAAFARRKPEGSRQEQRQAARLPPAFARTLRANGAAWEYLRARTDSYRNTVIRWVISAKREETRLRRLGILIEHSASGRPIPALARGEPVSRRTPEGRTPG
jgi:uncharacterized protein YdeI (YjbR/CyaY-like superfamily)